MTRQPVPNTQSPLVERTHEDTSTKLQNRHTKITLSSCTYYRTHTDINSRWGRRHPLGLRFPWPDQNMELLDWMVQLPAQQYPYYIFRSRTVWPTKIVMPKDLSSPDTITSQNLKNTPISSPVATIPTYVLSLFYKYRFSQDHIELFFGTMRGASGRYNNNPNGQMCSSIYRKLVFKLCDMCGLETWTKVLFLGLDYPLGAPYIDCLDANIRSTQVCTPSWSANLVGVCRPTMPRGDDWQIC